jgi:GDPmannose 4,6-dehydratase
MDWEKHVRIDPRYYRPAEVNDLRADCTKARTILGWQARVTFKQLVAMMVDADLAEFQLKLKGGLQAVAVSRD